MTISENPFEQLALKRKVKRWLKSNPNSEVTSIVESCINGIDPFELTRPKEIKRTGKKPRIDREDYWAIWTIAYKTSVNKTAEQLSCDNTEIRKFIKAWAYQQFMTYESFMDKENLSMARAKELDGLSENNFNEAIQLLKDKYGMG